MSGEGQKPPWEEDPFADDDEAARAREARRREREARRRGGGADPDAGPGAEEQVPPSAEERVRPSTERSLGHWVSGALERAREALSSARERLADRSDRGGDDPKPPIRGGGPESDSEDGGAGRRPRDSRDASPVGRNRLMVAGAVVAVLAAAFALISLGSGGGGSDKLEQGAAGGRSAPVFDLTIPEGLTRAQMDQLIRDEPRVRGNYMQATASAPRAYRQQLRSWGADDAPSLEGFLFPATYELERPSRASDLVAKQLEAFENNLAEVRLRQARERNLNVYDVVKIASMIEREIAVPEERRLASAVIYNRLSDSEPLAIDATLRYELENYDEPLTESELAEPTPFNTRLNAGLPPTPIGNPGLASLQAAANPADSDVRYYVVKPGTCNEHLFTADQAEFEEAVARYQAALEAEGGSPTEC